MNKHSKSLERTEKNKEIVIQSFVAHMRDEFGEENVSAEKIMNKIEKKNSMKYVLPDYFLHIKNSTGAMRTWSLVIKMNFHEEFLNDEAILKPNVVWTCKNRKEEFPNPYLIASLEDRFKLIPFYKFWFSDQIVKKYPEGQKEVFLIDLTKFDWIPYNYPVHFEK